MPCAQHSFFGSRKSQGAHAPYCRHADWWKSAEAESEDENPPRPYIGKGTGYVVPKKRKVWSLVLLASGLHRLTQAQTKVRYSQLEKDFNKLLKQWRKETSFHSSLGEIFTNEAYQKIIDMRYEVLPLILRELQKKPGHWFYALEQIVGHDVADGAKNFADARSAWLEWGYKNNYLKSL
jgi:hypothetical protein